MLRVYIELEKFVPVPGQYQFQYWNLDEMARRTHADGHDLLLTFVHATKAEQETRPKGEYQGTATLDQDAPPTPTPPTPCRRPPISLQARPATSSAARYGFNIHIPAANLALHRAGLPPRAGGGPAPGPGLRALLRDWQ
ncbi:MAG: hypothetical protein WKG07_38160 [Hymenobacter sp.]